VVTVLVEHKTALTRSAQQVHAGVAQLRGVHPVEIGGILEICLHIAAFLQQNYNVFFYPTNELCKK